MIKHALRLTFLIGFVSVVVFKATHEQPAIDSYLDEEVVEKPKRKKLSAKEKSSELQRLPASEASVAEISEKTVNARPGINPSPSFDSTIQGGDSTSSPMGAGGTYQSSSSLPSKQTRPNLDKTPLLRRPSQDSEKGYSSFASDIPGLSSKTPSPPTISDNTSNRSTGGTPNSTVGNTFACFSSIAEGSYSYSLSINLTCSSSGSIRYCLSEGGCCDPDSPLITPSPSLLVKMTATIAYHFMADPIPMMFLKFPQKTF